MATPRPVLVVTGRHRPHELLLLLFSLVSGLAYTLGSPPPQSVAASIDPWLVRAWSAGLLMSGAVGLLAALLPLPEDRALGLELGAMLIGAGALVLAAAAIFSSAGARGAFGAGVCAFWAAANMVRAFQVIRDLREVR